MAEIRPLEIDGQTIWVEVTDAAVGPVAKSGKTEKTSAMGDVLKQADIRETLSAVVGPIQDTLSAMKPSELSVELKLGFKADAGVFLAKTSGEASLTIKATWKS